jgi:hypothetical protein
MDFSWMAVREQPAKNGGWATQLAWQKAAGLNVVPFAMSRAGITINAIGL